MMESGIAGGLEAKKLPQIILSTKRFITYDNFSLISEILFIYLFFNPCSKYNFVTSYLYCVI